LYKCFISSFIDSKCLGGIIIVPLNFICSIRKEDIGLRKKFLSKFDIVLLNIFEEKVFNDTSYTICSLQFTPKRGEKYNIKTFIYPKGKEIEISLNKINNYTIGGEIYKYKSTKFSVERWTKKTINTEGLTNILLKCIDDNIKNRIKLSFVADEKRYIDDTPKLSARSYATLVIKPNIDKEKQNILVKSFNQFLEKERDKYHSLFLTNYRESNSICRKRISFDLAFNICGYLCENLFAI